LFLSHLTACTRWQLFPYLFYGLLQQYDQITSTIQAASESSINNVLLGLRAMSLELTAEAKKLNASWPFVTVPFFEVIGELAREKSGLEFIAMLPWVTGENALQWEQYSVQNQWWIDESQKISIASNSGLFSTDYKNTTERFINPLLWDMVTDPVTGNVTFYSSRTENPQGPFTPFWQMTPPPFSPSVMNLNVLSLSSAALSQVSDVYRNRDTVFTVVANLHGLGDLAVKRSDHDAFHHSLAAGSYKNSTDFYTHPHSAVLAPIFSELHDNSSAIVGILVAVLPWDRYLVNLLPESASSVTCILKNTCGQAFTYRLDGNSSIYMGEGDFHDSAYDSTETPIYFHDRDAEIRPSTCQYSLHLYASKELEDAYHTSVPLILAVAIAATFTFMMFTFFTYDRFVRRRNDKIVSAAVRSRAIVSSLFPSNVRDRLYAEQSDPSNHRLLKDQGTKSRLKDYLIDNSFFGREEIVEDDNDDDGFMFKSRPIADLFPKTTVLFADICGFTAWSSSRDPSQVFTLLETIYKSFDEIAAKYGVYKVETIGDCYVAVCGLPEPCLKHAVVMVRFARECLLRMQIVAQRLEVVLGPDTGDLSMRFGLHSGPVTAGVLRGERSRFQLFGDTMNTAARMESNGKPNKIHVSQETADQLIAHGKKRWLSVRADKILAKGKGEMQTYWVSTGDASSNGSGTREASLFANGDVKSMVRARDLDKHSRLVKWNVEALLKLLKLIAATRTESLGEKMKSVRKLLDTPTQSDKETKVSLNSSVAESPIIDEVSEIIILPQYKPVMARCEDGVFCDDDLVETELTNFVSAIGSMYRGTYQREFSVQNCVFKNKSCSD
jgi:class 3 adenylate cyclase